jgi:hypothetical protein
MPQEEIDGFVAYMFHKDPPTARPNTLPLPYSSDNPPPSVRITVLLLTFYLVINTFLWLVIQDLYPDRKIDVALSNEDNVRPNEPLMMMLEVMECLQLRHSLPIRSGPAQRGKPTLPLPIRLLPSLHQVVVKRKNMLCLGPSASKPKL